MSNSTRKKKKVFHSPERKGKLKEIPVTPSNRILSAVSLALQAGMTVFAVYAAVTRRGVSAGNGGYGIGGEASLLYLVFPAVSWLLTLGFRLACRYLPLDMWRLPVRVRRGFQMTEGTLLKLLTLLLELETALCFLYIDISLYVGYVPNDAVMLAWVAALALSVYLPGRQAARIADGIIKLPGQRSPKKDGRIVKKR